MSTQQSMLSLRCINGKEVLRVRNIKRLSTTGLFGLFTQHLPLEAADVCQGQIPRTDTGFSIKIPIYKFHKSCKE